MKAKDKVINGRGTLKRMTMTLHLTIISRT